jgi:ubiquinone/menaquinone biosynthesis C-methylase UbiE
MKGSTYYDEIFAKRGLRLRVDKDHFATQVMRTHCLHGRWLDVGCGCGQKDWHLAQANPVEITGLDFSPTALEFARGLPPLDGPGSLQWKQGNILALPFGPGLFDGCVCSHVLEHVEATGQLLAEMVRVTKPGGRLVIIVPHLRYADDPSHCWHFTLDQLGDLLFAYGAIDVSLSPCGNQIAAVVHLGGIDET